MALSACLDRGESFSQYLPAESKVLGLWKSEAVPRSLQQRYEIPGSMAFTLREDGSVVYETFSFLDLSNEVFTTNTEGRWLLRDANPLNKKGRLIKWELVLMFSTPNFSVALAIMERDSQHIMRYDWEPDSGAIYFVQPR